MSNKRQYIISRLEILEQEAAGLRAALAGSENSSIVPQGQTSCQHISDDENHALAKLDTRLAAETSSVPGFDPGLPKLAKDLIGHRELLIDALGSSLAAEPVFSMLLHLFLDRCFATERSVKSISSVIQLSSTTARLWIKAMEKQGLVYCMERAGDPSDNGIALTRDGFFLVARTLDAFGREQRVSDL